MENLYLLIVVVLIVLAISDLVVGVANDAVNFLNSAIGSKAAPLRVILFVAALGIIVGATFSSGMMEVARKGIFYPGQFSFANIMIIFLAVMLTDVILLDLFNTFGMPTSTTVSIVFELLGASVGMALLRISDDPNQNISDLAGYINSAKALAIISGILISVVIAFSVGAIVQYLSRLIFSFNYEKALKYVGAIWGGFAVASITYFILIKGAKGASWLSSETVDAIKDNTLLILGVVFAAATILLQLIIWAFKINILKLIVIIGTFALAMAFAGNDLVNFIGVPLAGYDSFMKFTEAGGGDANGFMMDVLDKKIPTPTLYLLIAGLIMVITLWLNKKAKSVIKTELSLSSQDETSERFESSALARTLVRHSTQATGFLKRKLPEGFVNNVGKRFNDEHFKDTTQKELGVNFDLIRASVNLIVASILIAIGTSLKLPLSTTYVTFMVAMGTSLADGAWDRESAVYRITGVVTVIGGWFFTALSAFTTALLVALFISKTFPVGIFVMIAIIVFVLYRTHVLHSKKASEEKSSATEVTSTLTEISDSIYETCSNNVVSMLLASSKSFESSIQALSQEKRRPLRDNLKSVKKLNKEAKLLKNNIPSVIKKLNEETLDNGHYYVEVIDYLREAMHSLHFIIEPCYKHVDNTHKPIGEQYAQILDGVASELKSYIKAIVNDISNSDYSNYKARQEKANAISELISKDRRKSIKNIKKESTSTRTNILFLDILNESKNLVLHLNNVYKSFSDFSEHYSSIELRKTI